MVESALSPSPGSMPERWQVPVEPSLEFRGFGEEAFGILDRLKAEPHIERYRREKEAIREHLTEPFKRYRDDLVVNWVLPNRLPFETERNVFSRLLKNDFGAGGCHHHLWMSFYRPGLRRLTDVQLAHRIGPDGFSVALFVGAYGKRALASALEAIRKHPECALGLFNALLESGVYELSIRVRGGGTRPAFTTAGPLSELPDELDRASDIWIRTRWERARVVAWGGGLVRRNLIRLHELWPLYLLFLNMPPDHDLPHTGSPLPAQSDER